MDHLVAHVENEQNILDLKQNTYEAIVDGAFETPWIKITQEGSNFGFNEITRLEMLDHFIENPDLLQEILALFPDSSKERIERIEKLKKRLKRVYLFNECKEVKDLTVMELLSENYNCTDEGTTKNII
uniref:Uncharacterized protein n=1 Tax=Acrobeloides nanus TaxID=290746 RepID=A0A914E3Y3_9BILA